MLLHQRPETATLVSDRFTRADRVGATHPHVAEMALAATHDGGLGGCDTNLEFEFALDVIIDGLERLRDAA
jgi:hypothetical protein